MSTAGHGHEQSTYTHLFANLDRVSSPARKKNTVTGLHVWRDDVTILVAGARANCDDGGLWERVVGSRTGEENT